MKAATPYFTVTPSDVAPLACSVTASRTTTMGHRDEEDRRWDEQDRAMLRITVRDKKSLRFYLD
jgi:hypothetical protein